MRLRFTIFLLVANLAVFGLIWNNAREHNRERPPSELIFPVDANRIRFVTTDSADESYELKQKAGRWSLETPFEWPANLWTVQKILDELRFLSLDQGFSLDEVKSLGNSLASYGLDKPRYTLTVSAGDPEGAGRRDTTVKIGAMTPDGSAAYLLAPDGKTVLPAPKSLLAALVRRPEDLRQPEVFSVQPFEVRAVSLTFEKSGQKTGVGLVRDKRDVPGRAEPDFIWRFETPVKSDADTRVVDKELSALGEMKFVRFLPATPQLLEKAGFSAPPMTISLDGNNRKQTLLVGLPDADSKGANVYAKFDDNPGVFTIPADALKPWAEVRRVMRDHRFMRFDAGALTGITVHQGGSSLVLHRIDAPAANGAATAPAKPEWQMPLVPGSTAVAVTPVDSDRLVKLVQALGNLTAVEGEPPLNLPADKKFLCDAFVTDDPTPEQLREWNLSKDSGYKRRVDLAFRDGTRRTLTIGGPIVPGTPYHAKLDDSPTVFSIAPGILDSLSVTPSAYRRRAIFPLPAGARVTSLKITDLATGKVLLDETKPDDVAAWETLLEPRRKAEREEVLALVALAGNLRAERFVDEKRAPVPFSEKYTYDEGVGLAPEGWRYRFEWTVKLPAGTEGERVLKHTLYLTRRIGGMRQVAGSPEENLVFELTRDWIDALHPLTFGRDSAVDLPAMPTPTPADAPNPAPGETASPAAAPAPTPEVK